MGKRLLLAPTDDKIYVLNIMEVLSCVLGLPLTDFDSHRDTELQHRQFTGSKYEYQTWYLP